MLKSVQFDAGVSGIPVRVKKYHNVRNKGNGLHNVASIHIWFIDAVELRLTEIIWRKSFRITYFSVTYVLYASTQYLSNSMATEVDIFSRL